MALFGTSNKKKSKELDSGLNPKSNSLARSQLPTIGPNGAKSGWSPS